MVTTAAATTKVDAALSEAGQKLRAMLQAADCLRVDNGRATTALAM